MSQLSNTQSKKLRDSNLELLRIFAMLAIIAHHFVVNSTVTKLFDPLHPTSQQYFLEIWGMWGKTAINSFILISGYFMCKMQLTWQRYLKLLIQIYFYGFIIMFIFGLTGYEPVTIKMVIKKFIGIFRSINNGFTGSFMCFYAFVPFYNNLINALNKRILGLLVIGLLFVMTICSSFLFASTMNEPIWYMTLYFVAAYIRNYPSKFTNSLKISSLTLLISVALSIFILVSCIYLTEKTGNAVFYGYSHHFVTDSNKILAFIVGTSAFLTAKNLPQFHNRFINTLSAGVFGVLLIHASSDTMRKWLWQDVVNVPGLYSAEMPILVIHAVLTPLIIYSVCAFIDYFRRIYIEKPLMSILNRKSLKGFALT